MAQPALGIYQKLADEKPDDPRFQSKLGNCCSEMVLCLSNRKEVDQSLEYLNRARALFQKLIESYPGQTEYKSDLAEIVNRIGLLDFTPWTTTPAWSITRNSRRWARKFSMR